MQTETEVLSEFEAILSAVDQIENFYDEHGHVPNAKVHEAQQLHRTMKERIEVPYKRMSTQRGQRTLTEVEQRFYKPTIDDIWQHAFSGSGVRWNSSPDGWRNLLYEVGYDTRRGMTKLKEFQNG
jgi:hypothetical protein